MDSEIAETLAAHADELADFDAKLYPKPWGSPQQDGQESYIKGQIDTWYTRTGRYPRRIRCSQFFLRELLALQLGSRRFSCLDDLALCAIYGVPISVDEAMTGFTMRCEA